MPPQAARTAGPPKGAAAPLNQSRAAHRIQAITNIDNLAEQRALERIGFRREGVMRGLAFDGGRWHDGVLYARLRDDPT
jgi:RimJ/RimL family protein N-acetyltransferase